MSNTTKLDKYDLYELCVQSPDTDVAVLRAIHAWFEAKSKVPIHPLVFSDEFSGGAALAKEWTFTVDGGASHAIDLDGVPLQRPADVPNVTTHCANVLDVSEPADIIAALNFAICEWHTRADLMAYLRHVRSRLLPHGVFSCDLYVGSDSLTPCEIEQELVGPNDQQIVYTWEQQRVDLLRNRVTNALHFQVREKHGLTHEFPSAFVYDWRLWSIAELRDAMCEVGFSRVEVFVRDQIAIDDMGGYHVVPAREGEDIDESDQVLVCAAD